MVDEGQVVAANSSENQLAEKLEELQEQAGQPDWQ